MLRSGEIEISAIWVVGLGQHAGQITVDDNTVGVQLLVYGRKPTHFRSFWDRTIIDVFGEEHVQRFAPWLKSRSTAKRRTRRMDGTDM